MNVSSQAEHAADADFRAQAETATATVACPQCQSTSVTCLESLGSIQRPFETALMPYQCECGFSFTVAHHGDGSPPEIWQAEKVGSTAAKPR